MESDQYSRQSYPTHRRFQDYDIQNSTIEQFGYQRSQQSRRCKYSDDDFPYYSRGKCTLNHSQNHEIRSYSREENYPVRQQIRGDQSNYNEQRVVFFNDQRGGRKVQENERRFQSNYNSTNQGIHQRRKSAQHSYTPFSSKELRQLSEKSTDAIKTDIIEIGDSFVEKINITTLEGDQAANFIRILSKITSPQEAGELSNKILSSFMESRFFQNLRDFTQDNQLQTSPTKNQYLLDLIGVLSILIDRFPSRINQLPISDVELDCRIHLTQPNVPQQALNEAMANLSGKQLAQMLQQKKARESEEESKDQGKKAKNNLIDNSYKTMPQNDFTQLDVIPGVKQLQLISAIRKMPETGDMINSHNYLDIVFRLLNEDAIRDLRNGISLLSSTEYCQLSKQEQRKKVNYHQIKHHEQLFLSGLEVIEGSICLQLRLTTNKKRFIDWRVSKKLLPGSLVVLSPDNFSTLFIGFIKSKDVIHANMTHQKFGYVPVNIEVLKTNTEIESITRLFIHYQTSSFQMIESGAYFEAYKHVLLQLQVMNTWPELPLERYLVRGDHSEMRTPVYIDEIFKENQSRITSMIDEMNLDESQFQALNQALNSELALIQGPPGTGKTFVGVQIVKILIEFQKYWKEEGPILLVTYTNHSLDQFLKQIKDFTPDIIRIGGRTTEESLMQFSLREKAKLQSPNRGYYQLKVDIKNAENKTNASINHLASYQAGYLNSFISTSYDARDIFADISQEFEQILKQHLKPIRNEDKYQISRKINNLLRDTNKNIVSLFWLGIIDIQAFINSLQDDRKPSNVQDTRMDLPDDQYYYDEREIDNYQFKQKKMEAVFGFLIDFYKPALASSQFRVCHTLQECISRASSLVFTENDQNEFKTIIRRYKEGFWHMPFDQKWKINNTILRGLIEEETDRIEKQLEDYKSLYVQKKELDQICDRDLIKSQGIIAMTTTGRAKYSHLLKNVKFPIVIVEEAAQVFEAHIVTSLTQETKHLILIGDHEQLKPNPSVYDLSTKYNLGMSLFERMIKNKIPHSTLDIQRRMRPEISKIMNFIYPNLKDHESVLQSPAIKGVSSNLFFYDHRFSENTNELMQSKFNIKEAQIVVRFAWYLLQQDYKAKNITILTLYAGQLLHIKDIVRKSEVYAEAFRNIRVVNVDNYQGEENDIILLSLVRSNAENQIGYLKISNRVCVALSRARYGLFIFGNSQCLLGSQLQLWTDVIEYLVKNSFIGPLIKLKCINHKTIAQIKYIDDFKNVPEGGCTQRCVKRMNCGHQCASLCHPYIPNEQDPTGHSKVVCMKHCERDKPCKHPCSFKCFQCKYDCIPCATVLEKEMLPCKHIMRLKCHEFESTTRCMYDCENYLGCGHKCKERCHEDCAQYKCKISVKRKLSCNHDIYMDCGDDVQDAYCYRSCKATLECGHQCKEKCGDCKYYGHAPCKQECSRLLICGHLCKEPCTCTRNCPPCEEQCITKCIHSQCSTKCKDVCVLCMEPCENACEHSKCTNFCSAPCNRELCIKRCLKFLECGHQCIGLCGELCPTICRVCYHKNEIFEIIFGKEEEPDSLFLAIDCGHIFEVSALDRIMEIDPTSTAVKFKQCPKCRQAIMSCRRYMTQINQVMNDVNAIKKIVLQQESQLRENLLQAYKNLDNLLKKLEKIMENNMDQAELDRIYKKCLALRKQIQNAEKLRQFDKAQQLMEQIQLVRDVYTLAIARLQHETQIAASVKEFINEILSNLFSDWDISESLATKEAEINELAEDLRRKFLLDDEMQEIINAIGESRGHWNKCPNGHFYVIGECGGAMQESKCPDCNAVIGGRDHMLAAGNQQASEFGGQSAWDPQGFNARVARGEVNLQDVIHD